MSTYKRPKNRIHRGFFYLDDETVINSLSAVESGKVDEVLARVNSAREGGIGGGIGVQGSKIEAGRRASSTFEEEMVRIRTRFSVFEAWYQSLLHEKAIGIFDGWGPDALDGVEPGDTVEFRATLETAPIQTLFRLFLWWSERAKSQGHTFSQKGDELKATKEAERTIRVLMGEPDDETEQIVVLATPAGDAGPQVAIPLKKCWLIGALGQLGGAYSVVGQVDRILGEGEELPALRLTRDVPATELEIATLKKATANFAGEPSSSMGIKVTEDAATIVGPALWVEPIAIFR